MGGRGGNISGGRTSSDDDGFGSSMDSIIGTRIRSRSTTDVSMRAVEETATKVNPNYSGDKSNWQYNRNCQRCVIAYELNRRGYDVEALPRSTNVAGGDALARGGWQKAFKGLAPIDVSDRTGLGMMKQLESWGNGSRAIVKIRNEDTGKGHVFIAENVNGRVVVIDPQNPNRDMTRSKIYSTSDVITVSRVDNLELGSKQVLKQAVKKRGGKK